MRFCVEFECCSKTEDVTILTKVKKTRYVEDADYECDASGQSNSTDPSIFGYALVQNKDELNNLEKRLKGIAGITDVKFYPEDVKTFTRTTLLKISLSAFIVGVAVFAALVFEKSLEDTLRYSIPAAVISWLVEALFVKRERHL